MADLFESVAAEIEARQAKLKPVIAEYERLRTAAAALDGVGRPPATRASAEREGKGLRDGKGLRPAT